MQFTDKSLGGIFLRLALAIVLAGYSMPIPAQDLAVVANPVGAPDELNLQDLRSIFKAEKTWWQGNTKISIALLSTTSETAPIIAEKIFEMKLNDVKKYWMQIVFQGKANPPKYFSSSEELIEYVEETPGAIGILDATSVSDSARVIRVDDLQ